MLNEERVKHMVKLALYETKYGEEELKTSSYYKKDYISYHVLRSVLLAVIAYVLVAVLLGLAFLSTLMEHLTVRTILLVGVVAIALFVGLLVTYIILPKKLYKRRHARAYHRVKKFKQDLEELERLYEKEESNGEAVGDEKLS